MAIGKLVLPAIVAVAAIGVAIVLLVSKPAGATTTQVTAVGPSLTIANNAVNPGNYLDFNAVGLTPRSAVLLDVLTNTNKDISLAYTGGLTADSTGSISSNFQIGSNIPTGANVLKITDVATGKTSTANFIVA